MAAESTDCPHMGSCEMYTLLRLSGSLATWQARYCKGTFLECARYKASLEGKPVPINLMPNGALLQVPASVNKPRR